MSNPLLDDSPAPVATRNPLLDSTPASATNPLLASPAPARSSAPAPTPQATGYHLPARVLNGPLSVSPEIAAAQEAARSPEDRARDKAADARPRAIIRQIGEAFNSYLPGINNPRFGAALQDLARLHFPGGPGSATARLQQTEYPPAGNGFLDAVNQGNFYLGTPPPLQTLDAANDQFATLQAKNLVGIRGQQAPYPQRNPLLNAIESGLPPLKAAELLARYGGNPLRAAAAEALEHPYGTGAASFAADALNPEYNAPFDLARIASGAARSGGVRLAARATEAEARVAAEKAAHADAANGVTSLPPPPVSRADRALAPLAHFAGQATRTRKAADGIFNRYAQQVGPEATGLVHGMEQHIRSAQALPYKQNDFIFGPEIPKPGQFGNLAPEGTTRAEQMEILKRSYEPSPESEVPKYEPNRAIDAAFAQRMAAHGITEPRSLDLRAAALREAIRDRSDRLVGSGVAKTGENIYDPGLFFPMGRYQDRKVYAGDAVTDGDGVTSLDALKYRTAGGSQRAGFAVSRRFLNSHKTQPPIHMLEDDQLDPDFLPAHQFLHHATQADRAIAQAEALKKAGTTGIEVHAPQTQGYRDLLAVAEKQFDYHIAHAESDDDAKAWQAEKDDVQRVLSSIGEKSAPARLPILYAHRAYNGEVSVLGLGDVGRSRAMRLEQYDREQNAMTRAQQEVAPGRSDLATGRGLANVSYIRGKVAGTKRSLADLAKQARSVGKTAQKFAASPPPGTKVIGDLDRVRTNIAASNAALDGKLAENLSKAADHSEAISTLRAAAEVDEREVAKFADIPKPSKQDVYELARSMRDETVHQGDEFLRAELATRRIQPDWIWDNRAQKWKLETRFTQVPARYLDKSNKPTMPPTPHQFSEMGVASQVGDADQIRTELGSDQHGLRFETEDEFLEHVAGLSRPPSIESFMEEAQARIDASHEAATGELATNRERIVKMRELADRLESESKTAQAAESALGPAGRAAVKSGVTAEKQLGVAIGKVQASGEGVVTRVQKAADRAANTANTRTIELDALATKLKQAKLDAQTRAQIEKRAKEIVDAIQDSVATVVDKKWGKLPEGYAFESNLRLGAVDSKAYGIEQNAANVLAEPLADPRGKTNEEVTNVMRSLDTLAQMVRFGIVGVPTVHVGGNLMMAHLAEFASRGTPAERAAVMAENARIVAGKGAAVADPEMAARAEAAGAIPAQATTTFGRYSKHEADVLTRSASELPTRQLPQLKLGPLAIGPKGISRYAIDQNATLRFYRPSTELVFEQIERGYATDAFARYVNAGMSDLQAGRKVRQLFGDYLNITGTERAGIGGVQLQGLLLFYPWLKTAVNFWTRKGILDGASSVLAPARAAQVTNSIEGYDDPSKPYTLTAGRRADGQHRRWSLPLAQRILQPLSDAAALPLDAAQWAATGDSKMLGNDARSAASIPLNRLNPFLSTIVRPAYDSAVEHSAPTYERFADPKASGPAQVGQAANRVFSGFAAPFKNMQGSEDDPAGSAAMLGLGFLYGAPGNGLRASTIAKTKKQIDALNAAGKHKEALQLQHALLQMQGAIPAGR